jgi:Zn2+/Cd2+-exporting ATPase
VTSSVRRSTWRTQAAYRTYASGALWMVGMVLALGQHQPDVAGWLRVRLDVPGVILLSSAIIGGWNFFPKAFTGLRRGRLDMNFLMTIAIVGALAIGEPIEAAAIAALFSFAELLEASAVTRARRSIEELVRLSPQTAHVVRDDGEEIELPTSDLRIGHRVRVRPGETIPIDGRVVDGNSAVDEATVTGESVPITKHLGDAVYASTSLVEGYLEIEVTADAGDTTLDHIVKLVREAQTRRSPTEQFVDRFARYYTPVVTALAAVTMIVPPLVGLGSGIEWFTRGLTLLVIACPCALVIATPVTIVSALTSAARHGVLIKGGEYVEELGRTCAMAFDKTGSLTTGRLEVTDVEGVDGAGISSVLALAAAVERRSEHPIAQAIVEHHDEASIDTPRQLQVADFESFVGRGVTAWVDGSPVRVGTQELFSGVVIPPRFAELQDAGKTVVLVGNHERVTGLIALADTPRPEAQHVLQRLRKLGVHEQIMLTGDHERVARRIGAALGIDQIKAGLLPEEKVRSVEQLRETHTSVAMLGDGVNDAPALAAASVGIAVRAAGSPATVETADVALMADDLNMLPYAVRVSQLARRLVRFNIVAALGIKMLLAAGAVGGVVSLLVAVLVGDLGASLTVTLNAMRLTRLD